MDYNFHTHTTHCRHAVGTQEEYVLRAIEGGIRTMGFSDHAALRLPDGYQSGHRVPVEEVEDYCTETARLREKYRDKITLYTGFEMEYLPPFFEEMVEQNRRWGIEYVILGQHVFGLEHPETIATRHLPEGEEGLAGYMDILIEGMRTGVYTYVAHPDMFRFSGDPAFYADQVRRVCDASKETQTPLEINFLGIRDHRNYPNEAFWKVVGEEGAPVVFGCDAHDVPSAFDGASLRIAEEIVARFGINYIGQPKLKLLSERK